MIKAKYQPFGDSLGASTGGYASIKAQLLSSLWTITSVFIGSMLALFMWGSVMSIGGYGQERAIDPMASQSDSKLLNIETWLHPTANESQSEAVIRWEQGQAGPGYRVVADCIRNSIAEEAKKQLQIRLMSYISRRTHLCDAVLLGDGINPLKPFTASPTLTAESKLLVF